MLFIKCFAPDDDFTEQLQMFRPHFESQFVPSSSSLQKCILTEHFFFPISWSLIPVFYLFLSLHAFQLLANHFLLSESNVCVVAQWCDLLVKAKADSKPFTVVFGSKPTNVSLWNGVYVWGVWDAFSTPHIHSKFTNSKPMPVTLAHVSLKSIWFMELYNL